MYERRIIQWLIFVFSNRLALSPPVVRAILSKERKDYIMRFLQAISIGAMLYYISVQFLNEVLFGWG
nr:MAG TPA: hypothetical protein [Caudoviricetes sp.]DAH67555.1 MAG TPA: hypothetical protein [Caudoviricetes sp.]